MRTYLVQTWNRDGSLRDHYEADLPGPPEVEQLRKFLKPKCGHVQITAKAEKPKTRRPK